MKKTHLIVLKNIIIISMVWIKKKKRNIDNLTLNHLFTEVDLRLKHCKNLKFKLLI